MKYITNIWTYIFILTAIIIYANYDIQSSYYVLDNNIDTNTATLSNIQKEKLEKEVHNLKAPELWHQKAAIRYIGSLKNHTTYLIDNIIPFLDHTDTNIQLEAAIALGKMGYKEHRIVPILIEAVQSHDHHYNIEAAIALGNMGSIATDASPVLLEMIEQGKLQERVSAYNALNQIGTEESLKAAAIAKEHHEKLFFQEEE